MVPFGRILIFGSLEMITKVNNRKIFVSMIIAVLVVVASSVVYSHCQIPCGIYDDNMRINMMAEHITTIEKSMRTINQLSAEKKPNMNQLVRWVRNKDNHADELSHIITYYFMAQRLKPVEKTGTEGYQKYLEKLTLLHQILVSTMKTKQTTDLSETKQLTDLLINFKKVYSEEHEHKHEH
jgi:nickel superoxide dismutase